MRFHYKTWTQDWSHKSGLNSLIIGNINLFCGNLWASIHVFHTQTAECQACSDCETEGITHTEKNGRHFNQVTDWHSFSPKCSTWKISRGHKAEGVKTGRGRRILEGDGNMKIRMTVSEDLRWFERTRPPHFRQIAPVKTKSKSCFRNDGATAPRVARTLPRSESPGAQWPLVASCAAAAWTEAWHPHGPRTHEEVTGHTCLR